MIQFIFIFPIIYFIVKKFGDKGVVICGFINFVYEVLKNVYGVSLSTYRLLVFRYIFVIAAGCYMSDVEERQEEIEYKHMHSRRIGVLSDREACYRFGFKVGNT